MLQSYFLEPNALRSVIILAISLVLAYLLSNFVAKAIIKLAQLIATQSDTTSNEQRALQLRRVETYLSVTVALVRVLFVAVVGYVAWIALSPAAHQNSGAAAIGASALFIVLASATIGPLLRDVTAGATMIIERWFNVGDHIRVEPFWELAGVVERVTLRSTRIRSLNGEVVWLHNQHIQGVRVTPRGVRTLAVDVFVTNQDKGMKMIQKVIDTMPIGNNMLTKKLKVTEPEKLSEQLWRITVSGQTAPGREWLLEKFFVASITDLDKAARGPKIIVHQPMVRFADPEADRKFKRAVRIAKDS